MKTALLSAAVLAVSLVSATAHADSFNLNVMTGSSADSLTYSTTTLDGVAAQEYTYSKTTTGYWLSSTSSLLTIIYAPLSSSSSELKITDSCSETFGWFNYSAPACQSFSISLTGLVLGDGLAGKGILASSSDASGSAGTGTAILTIAGSELNSGNYNDCGGDGSDSASALFKFSNTPTVPNVAATPEPSSLCLMATGLIGAGGLLRRRASRA